VGEGRLEGYHEREDEREEERRERNKRGIVCVRTREQEREKGTEE
jgi:hypothetical protein